MRFAREISGQVDEGAIGIVELRGDGGQCSDRVALANAGADMGRKLAVPEPLAAKGAGQAGLRDAPSADDDTDIVAGASAAEAGRVLDHMVGRGKRNVGHRRARFGPITRGGEGYRSLR